LHLPSRRARLADDVNAFTLMVLKGVLDAKRHALHIGMLASSMPSALRMAAAISEAVMGPVAVLSTSSARL
jgi:hypothetical protein